MKLSAFLLNLLCDPARRASKNAGVCSHVDYAVASGVLDRTALTQFARAVEACKQTASSVYPVRPAGGGDGVGYEYRAVAYKRAQGNKSLWRGEYGRNRRKFLRDCIHYLKERGI